MCKYIPVLLEVHAHLFARPSDVSELSNTADMPQLGGGTDI